MDRTALFLDRDGVINKAYVKDGKSYPPSTLEEFIFLDRVKEALLLSRSLGFLNILVTNQPDVGEGRQSLEVVNKMHEVGQKNLPIDDIFVCTHVDLDYCVCRKPLPGMLIAAAEKWQIDLKRSFLVGDRWRDVGAAHAVGCEAFFVDYGYDEQRPSSPYHVVTSLYEAVGQIRDQIR